MEKSVAQVAFLPAAPKRKRVAAYARVSSGKDAMLHSLSAQVSYYNALIQGRSSWEFAGVYADEAKTGTRDSRNDFQRMLTDCRMGKVDMVLTKSISRFARNTVVLLATVRELKALGVDVFFEEQNLHSISADGELLLSILASYAQEESHSVSENQKWRIKKSFEEGMPWNGTMLGYRYNKGQLVIELEEAETVRFIFDAYLAGKGITAIAKLLNEKGVRTRYGNTWGATSIPQILRNYSYTGNLLLQQTYREDCLTKRKCRNYGALPQYHVDNAHEAIISMETFTAVQMEMKRRAEKYTHPGSKKKAYPFTGLIVCGCCGAHYRRKVTAAGAVWICSTYNSKGKAACASKQIPECTLTELTAEMPLGDLSAIRAENGNVLVYCFQDGSESVRRWQDRSRTESWTPEMKQAARQKARQHR